MKRKAVCPHCKNRLGTVRNDEGRSILLDIGGKANAASLVKKQMAKRSTQATEEEDKKDIQKPSTLNPDFFNNSTIEAKADDFLDKQLQQILSGKCNKLAWRAREVREHFRRLWKNEQHIIRYVYPIFDTVSKETNQCPMDILFMQTILVPPSKYRPLRNFGGQKFESPSTVNYRVLLETDELLRMLYTTDNFGDKQSRINVNIFTLSTTFNTSSKSRK